MTGEIQNGLALDWPSPTDLLEKRGYSPPSGRPAQTAPIKEI